MDFIAAVLRRHHGIHTCRTSDLAAMPVAHMLVHEDALTVVATIDRRACQRRAQPYSLQAVLVVVFKCLLQVPYIVFS